MLSRWRRNRKKNQNKILMLNKRVKGKVLQNAYRLSKKKVK